MNSSEIPEFAVNGLERDFGSGHPRNPKLLTRDSDSPYSAAVAVHCVQRCVRRAFLCGVDEYTGQSFEHRKDWVEQRLLHLASCFGISLLGYAVMSNHMHVVLRIEPAAVAAWSDADVAARWVKIFPSHSDQAQANAAKQERLRANAGRSAVCRQRLSSLSWFMRCLAEPLARRANREDSCKGRFWEGRYKCQRLLDDRAILAAMVYVDLNPVRAGIADHVASNDHTSAALRLSRASANGGNLQSPMSAVAGPLTGHCLPISEAAYLQLLDWTGRQVHPGKRGRVAASAPPVLTQLGIGADRWAVEVRGIGSGYWRAVGGLTDLLALASALGQRWVKGQGFAKGLARA